MINKISLATKSFRMELWCKFSVLFLVLFIGGCHSPSKLDAHQSPYQAPELFNNNWEFYKSTDDLSLTNVTGLGQWEKVSLPHTPKIELKNVHNQWQGFSWYRKKLDVALLQDKKKIFIDFEAAMNVADVWVNTTKIAHHLGGYLPFSIEVSSYLTQQDNWLYVKLDNRDNPITGPKPLKSLDFNTYGGLYRNVWLRRENTTYITDAVSAHKVASGGIFVTYPEVTAGEAKVQIKTHMNHNQSRLPLQLVQSLYLADKLVAKDVSELKNIAAGESQITQLLTVKTPGLWSPASPTLYRLVTDVTENGILVDQKITKIGIREFKIVDNTLFINGNKTFLRGVNRHQEYPYVGYAMSDAAQYRDAEKIKAAGFDYVRLSHYPHSNAFMNAADELGLVLLDSILGWQYFSDAPEFTAQVVDTCRDLIRRDRNHPSVLAWECSLNESAMPKSLVNDFTQVVHQEFPGNNVYSAGWQDDGYDIYLQARQHRLGHVLNSTTPYIVSEYGDWEYYAMNAGLNQDKWSNLLQAERSSRQLLGDGDIRLQQQAANLAESHNDNFNTPAFADGYWVMFDYNRGYAEDLESSGIMSIDRLPKFSYYFFQSQRNANEYAGPTAKGYMVYIASHWLKNSSLSIPIFSNAEKVEIFLNGKSLGMAHAEKQLQHLAHPPFSIKLKHFVAGKLEAVAYADGKPVARHAVVTPGQFKQIALSLDNSAIKPQANVNDEVFVYAELQDENGNNTRANHAPIKFNLSGDAELLSAAEVETEAGIAAALIRVGKDVASIKIGASYNGVNAKDFKVSD